MAKVIQEFPGVPDGETRVRVFAPGEVVTGDLARVAIEQGWAQDEEERKAEDDQDDTVLTASEVLAKVDGMKDEFMAWKALAATVLGDETPAKKADIIAALQLRAEEDAKA